MAEEDKLPNVFRTFAFLMSEKEKERFTCDRCEKTFDTESQMNAHKVSVHSVAGGS